jgi:hypothetical protein
MNFVPKLLENLANFRAWRDAQSSIRIQEGPPRKIPLFVQILTELREVDEEVYALKYLTFQVRIPLRVGAYCHAATSDRLQSWWLLSSNE